jgi:septal ring factor EnvC (AmiA/AmiB activator)
MKRAIHRIFFSLLVATCVAAGCSTPNSQLTACQQDKEQLLAAIREQRETGRTLKAQVASLETRLHQAETELARGTSGTRISTRPAESSSSAKPVKGESLPWRSPPVPGNSPAQKPTGKNVGFQVPEPVLGDAGRP